MTFFTPNLANLRFLFVIVSLLSILSCEEVNTNELYIGNFIIQAEINSAQDADLNFEIKGDSLLAKQNNHLNKKRIASFVTNATSVTVNGKIQVSGETENDFSTVLIYTLSAEDGRQKNVYVKLNWVTDSLPHIYINTEGNAEIISKEDYLQASIKVEGKGKYPDYNGTTQIRGRGNSTWGYPKKPYRLKLSTKAEMLGLSAERDWVLLANYIDPTLMLNAVAMKIGQQINTPFVNHIVPVDVSINGVYMGSYMFTEQVEVETNRVNVGANGYFFELDARYDETYKFRSQYFNLPVLIKHPELTTTKDILPIQQQFNQMEQLLAASDFPNNGYTNLVDINSVADFLLVNLLTANQEINYPKSTFLHKTQTGKFTMGPLWDFDWAYGYNGTVHFTASRNPFLTIGATPVAPGTVFFTKLLKDPAVLGLLAHKWAQYKNNHFDNLIKFVDTYSAQIETSKKADYEKWKKGDVVFENDVKKLKKWLIERKSYIDSYLQTL